jgi:hypothetical protein
MDSIGPAVILTIINIIGWLLMRFYALGKLNEKVNEHDKILNNGIVKELNQLKTEFANLEGTVKTYIDLTKRG